MIQQVLHRRRGHAAAFRGAVRRQDVRAQARARALPDGTGKMTATDLDQRQRRKRIGIGRARCHQALQQRGRDDQVIDLVPRDEGKGVVDRRDEDHEAALAQHPQRVAEAVGGIRTHREDLPRFARQRREAFLRGNALRHQRMTDADALRYAGGARRLEIPANRSGILVRRHGGQRFRRWRRKKPVGIHGNRAHAFQPGHAFRRKARRARSGRMLDRGGGHADARRRQCERQVHVRRPERDHHGIAGAQADLEHAPRDRVDRPVELTVADGGAVETRNGGLAGVQLGAHRRSGSVMFIALAWQVSVPVQAVWRRARLPSRSASSQALLSTVAASRTMRAEDTRSAATNRCIRG